MLRRRHQAREKGAAIASPVRAADSVMIGYALSIVNPILRLEMYGSPREVIEELRSRGLDLRTVASHEASEIRTAEVFKDEPPLEFGGGPYAETIIEAFEALRRRDIDTIAALLHGAPGVVNSAPGSNALLLAAVILHVPEAADFLLSEGLQVDHETQFGMTALHWAAARGEVDIVKLLMARGADPERLNWFFMSPFELAHVNGQRATERAIAELLGRELKHFGVETVLSRIGA